MANLEELVVEISADTKSLVAELKASTQATKLATEQMSKTVEDFSKKSSDDVGFFERTMSTMAGVVGGEIVLGALKAAKDAVFGLANTMITEGVAGAIAQQDAQNQLNQALARSGEYSKSAANDFEAYASQIQATTNYQDDAVLSAGALIQSMAQLSQEGLKKATDAAINLAAGLNIDLTTASRVVAKAVDGNVEALGRYNIKVQEGSTKSETMANVLDALSNKFGGTAAAQAQTYSGQLTIMSNNFGEVQEAIGETIVKNQAIIETMKAVNTIITQVGSSVSESKNAFAELIAQGLIVTISAMKDMVIVAELVIQTFRGVYTAVTQTFQNIADASSAVSIALGGDVVGALDFFVNAVDRAGKATDAAFSDPTVLSPIIDGLNRMGTAAESGYAELIAGTDSADPKVKNLANSFDELTVAQMAAMKASEEFKLKLIEQSESAIEQETAKNEMLKANLEEGIITDEEYWAAKQEAQQTRFAQEEAQLALSNKNKSKDNESYAKAQSQLSKNQDAEQRKMAMDKKKFDDDMDKQRLANLQSTLGTISSLSNSHNKGLSALGKAAAVTQATIDGYVAVQKALASAPPPFNYALAAAVGVAAAANVANIVGTPLATGIDSVPGIGSRDNFPAVLAPGERVVPRETNQDLTRFLESGGQSQQNQGPIEIVLTMKDNVMDFFEAQLVERSNLSLSLRGV